MQIHTILNQGRLQSFNQENIHMLHKIIIIFLCGGGIHTEMPLLADEMIRQTT